MDTVDIEALRAVLRGYSAAKVLVVGDVMLDRFVYGSVRRISPEAPIPVLAVEREVDALGGAANVARNIVTLGASCQLIGVVGTDAAADALRRLLARYERLVGVLIPDCSRPTTVKWRHVAEGQQVLRADWESAQHVCDDIATQIIFCVKEALSRVDLVILSDYAKGVLTDRAVAEIIAACHAAGCQVVVDPKSQDFGKYRGADVLTPNRHELQLASTGPCIGDEQVASSARHHVEHGICRQMVVTRARDGLTVVADGAQAIHIRAIAREVYDVSGAGDTVVAALAAGLASGSDVVASATLANIAAGIVVGKHGTAEVTGRELVDYLDTVAAGMGALGDGSLDAVQAQVQQWKRLGLRVAFTNGCFDLLHPGHLALLAEAKRSADRLVVGLNSDSSVRRLKGASRPVQNEAARASVLSALRFVDAVVIFGEDTPLEIIKALVPDVLVKGADYTIEAVVGADFVKEHGGAVRLVELVPSQSTSNTIRYIGDLAGAHAR